MDKAVAIVLMVFFAFMGTLFGGTVGREMIQNRYKTCRHYDQPIERCVIELGWEKK